MTIATRNGCHICVAMHTARLTALGASPDLIAALRDGPLEPLADERLDAIRVFTLRVLDTAGDVGDQALRDFLARGYTTQNALEVVLGIGTYTMSTLANRLTGAPVDDQLALTPGTPEAFGPARCVWDRRYRSAWRETTGLGRRQARAPGG